MQTAVTVVNLIHDTKNETDTPVCWPFPVCSWRECRSTSGNGTAKDPQRNTHVRIPAGVCTQGYLPYAQWAALSAAEKEKHWTLKRGWKLVQGAVRTLTAEEYDDSFLNPEGRKLSLYYIFWWNNGCQG